MAKQELRYVIIKNNFKNVCSREYIYILLFAKTILTGTVAFHKFLIL